MTEFLRPIEFSEADLGLDAIKEVPTGGHFFGSPHTMERYETAFYKPLLSDWRNYENWLAAGGHDAPAPRDRPVAARALEEYEAPAMDPRDRRGTGRLYRQAPRRDRNGRTLIDDGDATMTSQTEGPAITVCLVLVPGFSMLSMVTVLETMRIANRLSGRAVFAWSITSETGGAVTSSLGIDSPVDAPLGEPRRGSIVLICGGTEVQATASRATMAWLRRCATHGVTLGGLCTGSYVLARAGLLRNRRATIHWEQGESFRENFPDVELSTAPYEVDGTYLSTAGGTAGIDLLLEVMRNAGFGALAGDVAAQLMYVNIHDMQARADIGRPARMSVRNPKVVAAVRHMEETVENVRPIVEIADGIGISVRQLERLFRTYMNDTPTHYYMRLRLDRALRLLLQTDLSLTDVAFATGFHTSGSFARKFRERFGHPPSSLRR